MTIAFERWLEVPSGPTGGSLVERDFHTFEVRPKQYVWRAPVGCRAERLTSATFLLSRYSSQMPAGYDLPASSHSTRTAEYVVAFITISTLFSEVRRIEHRKGNNRTLTARAEYWRCPCPSANGVGVTRTSSSTRAVSNHNP